MKVTQNTSNVSEDYLDDLYAKNLEITKFLDFEKELGTSIPAPYSEFYKFITNPSTVSVMTFKRMIDTDDTIGSGVDIISNCIMSRLGEYQHSSEEITNFVKKQLTKIEGGFESFLKKMLSATWAGFSINEMIWDFDGYDYFVRAFQPITPDTVMFEVDRAGNITSDGIVQYQKTPQVSNYNNQLGYNTFFASNSFYGFNPNPDYLAKMGDFMWPVRVASFLNYYMMRLPRNKVVHYAFDSQGNFKNPYGRSLLRRIYKWWINKDYFIKSLATALDRKGTPLILVYSQEYAGMVKSSDEFGVQSDMTPGQAVTKAFSNVHNDSVINLPGRKGDIYDVDVLSQQSNASDFIAAIELCNKSILRGLLIPPLLFGNGDGSGSYALAQENARSFEKMIDGTITGLKNAIIDQYIKPMLLFNFDEALFKKDGYGDFAYRQITGDEKKSEIEMVEKLINIGVINVNDLNDLNKVREMAGFETVKEDFLNTMEKEKELNTEEELNTNEY